MIQAHILLGHSWAALYHPHPVALMALNRLLTVSDSVYVGGRFDTRQEALYYRSLDGSSLVFLAGFYPRVVGYLQQCSVEVVTHDQRQWDVESSGIEDGAAPDLYDDQEELMDAMVSATRGIVHASTNAGKSFVAAGYWHAMGRPKMLWATPSVAVVEQNAQDFEKACGLPSGAIGRVGGGVSQWKGVCVATNAAISNYVKTHQRLPHRYGIFIADEGDTLVAKSADVIVNALAETPYRFWMSGTPFVGKNSHDVKMVGLAGEPLARTITNRELIDKQRSANPVVLFVPHCVPPFSATGWQEIVSKGIDQNTARAELCARVIQSAVQRHDLVVLCFTEHIVHAKLLASYLDVPWVITGQSTLTDHRAGIQRLNSGDPCAIIATGTWRRGLSIPAVDLLINAAGGKSARAVLQRFGRLLRKKTVGENVGYYVDFLDEDHEVLARHARRRAQMFIRERISVYLWPPNERFDIPGVVYPILSLAVPLT